MTGVKFLRLFSFAVIRFTHSRSAQRGEENGSVKRFALLATMLTVGFAAGLTAMTATVSAAPPLTSVSPSTPPTVGEAATDNLRATIDALRNGVLGPDRAGRIAAYETGRRSADDAVRRAATDAALESRDPALTALAVRDWLGRVSSVPVLLYAVKEESGSPAYLQNLGPLTFKPIKYDPVSGAVTAELNAPGYDMTRDAAASGTLARTTLVVNTFGCQLAVQLTEHRTLDGLYRCRTLPTLAARIVLD